MDQRFRFAFDPRFERMLGLVGIRPTNAYALLDDEALRVTFGRLGVTTPTTNISDVQITGGYRWYRAIGPRLSLADHGATFGTNAEIGACIRFREPVPGLLGQRLRHPGLTLTLEDPRGFAHAVLERIRH